MRVLFDGSEFDVRNMRVVVILAHAELPVLLHDVAGHTVVKLHRVVVNRAGFIRQVAEHQRPVANIDGAVAIIRRHDNALPLLHHRHDKIVDHQIFWRDGKIRRLLQDIRRRALNHFIHFRMGVAPRVVIAVIMAAGFLALLADRSRHDDGDVVLILIGSKPFLILRKAQAAINIVSRFITQPFGELR